MTTNTNLSVLLLRSALPALSLFTLLATPQAGRAQDGIEVKLSAQSEFTSATGVAELLLTVYVKEDAKVPAALLSGLKLKTTIDGKAGPRLRESASGVVKMSKGTRFARPLTIDMKNVVPNLDLLSIARVTFEWDGVKGASTFVRVAPDLKEVAVDSLDLAKTQVSILTNHGEMVLGFHPGKAPNTVKNFIKLAKNGFYDTSGFHRVIPGFMIQGGCPNSKPGADGVAGTGSPGYTVKAEFNDTRHVKGVISMARSQNPDSAGCQFFIVHATSGHLDGKYTAFGALVSGQDTLDKIATTQCNGSKPIKPVTIMKMIVKPAFKK